MKRDDMTGGADAGNKLRKLEYLLAEAKLRGANVVLTSSTKIIDVTQPGGEVHRGRVPARSVVIPGSIPKEFPGGTFHVPAALIIGRRKESTDRKTSLNAVLRDFAVPV